MNSKYNQILIGVILLLVGVLTLGLNAMKFEYRSILLFAGGLAFLLLYRTKRKGWSLTLGTYMSYMALVSIKIGSFDFGNIFLPTMFFACPAIIFLVLYFDKGKQGLLLPGFILIWFSVFIALGQFNFLSSYSSIIFCYCIAFAFLMTYHFGKAFIRKWTAYLATVFLCIGTVSVFKISSLKIIFEYLPQIGSIVIIVISVIIIISGIIKKNKGQ